MGKESPFQAEGMGEGSYFRERFVKGVPFQGKVCEKGANFQNLVCERVRGPDLGRSIPI